MSEKWVHDAITMIKGINKLELKSEYMHLLERDYLTMVKDLETLELQVQVLDLSTKSFDKETGEYIDQLYNVGIIRPMKNFRLFISAVYNELGKAYSNENWAYIDMIGNLIHIIDSQAVRTILIYNSFMKRSGIDFYGRFEFRNDYNREWKQVFDEWFEYAEYLPLLSHVKIEYDKAVETPDFSYLDYFSTLPANNYWGVLSEIIIGEDEELKILGYLDNSSLDAIASSVIGATARIHGIQIEERYIREITFSRLLTVIFELHQQAFYFSNKDFDFIMSVLRELEYIYNILNQRSDGSFESEYAQVKELIEKLQKMSSSFIN